MKPGVGADPDIESSLRAQFITPMNITMAVGNALMAIRSWEFKHQQLMSDLFQIEIIMAHISDFVRGRAFIFEHRKESFRAFIDAICPDEYGLDLLQEALDEKKKSA